MRMQSLPSTLYHLSTFILREGGECGSSLKSAKNRKRLPFATSTNFFEICPHSHYMSEKSLYGLRVPAYFELF